MATAGSWFGLPDFGITESLAKKLSRGGTTDLSNAITGNYSPQASGPTDGGSVQGDSTVAGPTYSGVKKISTTPTPTSSIVPETNRSTQNAQDERSRTLSAIQSRLDETRRLAKEKIARAAEDRSYITDTVAPRFDDLITRANERRTSQLDDLGTEETKTQNLYDKAAAQARRRTESAGLKNRLVARAGNRLGSSFYDDLVAGNQEGLIRTLGENDTERLDKVGAIGKRKTETERYFDDTTKEINNQKTDAISTAEREYKDSVSAAEALDRAGVLDFGEGLSQAESTLSSRLDQIDQWAKNVALKKMELDSIYTKGNASVDSYNAFDDNLNTSLAQNNSLAGTQGYTADVMGTPTGGNNSGVLAQLMAMTQQPKKKETTIADILANLGNTMTPSYAYSA